MSASAPCAWPFDVRPAPASRRVAFAVIVLSVACAAALGQTGLTEEPLAPRSGPKGATMFTLLPPSQTGVAAENAYADPTMWGDRYDEFVYGAIGTGVAIGDYDSDGRPDVYVVGKLEGGRLFRNLGGWSFEDVTERAGVSGIASGWIDRAKGWMGLGGTAGATWFQGATFADADNDGHLDLYVCRFGGPNLLFMNKGDGTFTEEADARGLALNDASGVGAFCDFDRDGWLDVYVQTNLLDVVGSPTGQRDRLYRNNGDGTFADVTDRAGIRGETQGHSAIWWDFDNDGWPDLYVANDFAPPDSLYRNNGDGTFTDVIDRVLPMTPHSSMGSDLGDVDNDGLVDFLVADMAATSHEKDQRGMATNRARLDEARGHPGVAPQYMRNALYLNTGAGPVREAAFLAGLHASDWTWSVRLEDLDNDGRIDAFFTNGMVRELNNVDLVARTSAAESVGEQVRIMRDSPVLAQANLAFRNLGDLRFESTGAAWGLDQRGVSFGAAFGDLDGDGDLDLVHVDFERGPRVLRNDSDSGHRLVVALRGTRSNKVGIGARVKIETRSGVQVRELVVSRGYLSSSEPVLHFGLGGDERIDRLTVFWSSGAVQTFADIASNRRLTITEPSSVSTPDRASAERLAGTDSARGVSGFGGSPLNDPGLAATRIPSPPMFSPATPPQSFVRADPARAIADFDRDGKPDEFVGGAALPGQYPSAARSALIADREGARRDVTNSLAPGLAEAGLVTASVWCDADADGWPDLVVASDWGGVRFFRNDRGRRLEDRSAEVGFESAGLGRWSALEAGDFNGDGRPDIVAGNLGLNTRYRASADEPALLFLGDFGAGKQTAVEGYHGNGVLLPWLSRGEMASIVPGMRRRFARNDHYARATLPEIVGEQLLTGARKFSATELRSGVLMSQPDGRYRFEPLPRIAQIAPARGIAVADFDGDGFADIHVVQNSHKPPPSVGRFGGGVSQLLLGDGRGGFAPVPPEASGLIVAGEAAAVVAGDLDGDGLPDLVVTMADGSTAAFRNNGASTGANAEETGHAGGHP